MLLTAPSLPIYMSLPVSAAVFVLVVIQLWRLRDIYVGFLLLAMWLRYSLASIHPYTYPPMLFGFSIVALSSILIVAVGIFLIGPRKLLLQKLAPFYFIILIVLISSAVNQTWMGAINTTLKWLFLIVFAVASYIAIERHGADRV